MYNEKQSKALMHKVYSTLSRAGLAKQVSLYRNANNSVSVVYRDARERDDSVRTAVMVQALNALTGKVNVIARIDGGYRNLHVLPVTAEGTNYHIGLDLFA